MLYHSCGKYFLFLENGKESYIYVCQFLNMKNPWICKFSKLLGNSSSHLNYLNFCIFYLCHLVTGMSYSLNIFVISLLTKLTLSRLVCFSDKFDFSLFLSKLCLFVNKLSTRLYHHPFIIIFFVKILFQ